MSVKYSEDHAWVKVQDEDLVTIGITDFAQEQLGDLVYIELPKVGHECSRGDNISVIESVKSASDLVAPVSGEIVEVNDRLEMIRNLFQKTQWVRVGLLKLNFQSAQSWMS